jgi:membrane-bound metal-dependent hydrolase YbcI (DUF457 family)
LSAAAPGETRRGHTSKASALGFTPFVLGCGAVAALPDADLLFMNWHRTATHSVTATAVLFIVTAVVTGKVTGRPGWRLAAALAAAHATHLLLDWLGTDRFFPAGIQLFWPFSDTFYISGLDIFSEVERRLLRPEALAINTRAALRELAILGPIAAMTWLMRWVRLRTPSVSPPSAEREPSV